MLKKKTKLNIAVGVSGGVDSSVSLALLKEQGHNVVGVFMRTWQPEWIECTWRAERRDAMRVCAHLDVPFVELDLEREYKEGVADYMIREYKKGRTPNPDVMCNREVKFGGFLTWAREHNFDYVATGHYVDRKEKDNGDISMLRGNDPKKDQSYFLWTLEQHQLQHILFPVGNIPKSKVRALAKKYQLPTASKKDSQGICFIGEIDMKDFLAHYIQEQPGNVIDIQGNVIGNHNGSFFYTIGERHGFTIDSKHKKNNGGPYYVIAKNIETNTITVSENPTKDQIQKLVWELVDVVDNQNFFKEKMRLEVQIRYRGEVKSVTITEYDQSKKIMQIEFSEHDPSLAPGQSVVFYDGDVCLGGGILA